MMREVWLVLAGFLVACGGSVSAFGTGNGGSGASGGGSSTSSSGGADSSTSTSSGVSYGDCIGAGECIVVNSTCCGVCGSAQVEEVSAIAGKLQQAYQEQLCVGDPICPACDGWLDGHVFAYCERDPGNEGQCVVADIRLHELSECKHDDDCRLRLGVNCCEGCSLQTPDGSDLIAINKDRVGDLRELVCGPNQGCDDCAPVYPPGATPACIEGRCDVVFAGPSGG